MTTTNQHTNIRTVTLAVRGVPTQVTIGTMSRGDLRGHKDVLAVAGVPADKLDINLLSDAHLAVYRLH